MRIIYFGDGPWAHKALDLILEKGFDVVKVVVRNDKKDQVLLDIAKSHGIDAGWHPNINSVEFLSTLKSQNIVIAVSMSFNQIVRKNTLDFFPLGFINCHAGKLPNYRGRNILNWALINDEKEIGVTCHYIDEGIDTGDIILQKTFPVVDSDDYRSVLKKAIDLCPEVLLESMEMIRNGTALRQPQPAEGTYFVQRKIGDEFIDWSWSARRVFNFTRAIANPGPQAYTWLEYSGEHTLVRINKTAMIQGAVDYICTAGAVVGIRDGKPVVKCGDNTLILLEYEIEHPKKNKLRVGDRLGLNTNKIHLEQL